MKREEYRIIGRTKWVLDAQHGNYTKMVYYKVQRRRFFLFWKDMRIDSVFYELETPSAEAAERTIVKLEND